MEKQGIVIDSNSGACFHRRMDFPRFDAAAYRTANERIIGLIKRSHDWENTEGFIADGVICPDEYEKQSMRILCVLAESYGYDECGITSIELQPTRDVLGLMNKTVKTPRTLSALLWLLQTSFERGSKVTWDDMPWLFRRDEVATLQNALSKVAWINVKKASRHEGTNMDPDEVFMHAVKNKIILREQLEMIAPQLIIVCGKVVFRALHQMKLLGPEVMPERAWKVQAGCRGSMVVEVSHPRNWWAYAKVYRNFEDVYAQISRR